MQIQHFSQSEHTYVTATQIIKQNIASISKTFGYRLLLCVSSILTCRNLNPQCKRCLEWGPLAIRVIWSGGWHSCDEISALIKRVIRGLAFLSAMWENNRKRSICKLGGGPSRNASMWAPDTRLCTPRAVRNGFLWLKPWRLSCFVMAARVEQKASLAPPTVWSALEMNFQFSVAWQHLYFTFTFEGYFHKDCLLSSFLYFESFSLFLVKSILSFYKVLFSILMIFYSVDFNLFFNPSIDFLNLIYFFINF